MCPCRRRSPSFWLRAKQSRRLRSGLGSSAAPDNLRFSVRRHTSKTPDAVVIRRVRPPAGRPPPSQPFWPGWPGWRCPGAAGRPRCRGRRARRRFAARNSYTSRPAAAIEPVRRGVDQGLLVYHQAPRGVDQDGRRLHLAQLIRPDEVASLVRQGGVQADEVAFGQAGVQVNLPGPDGVELRHWVAAHVEYLHPEPGRAEPYGRCRSGPPRRCRA